MGIKAYDFKCFVKGLAPVRFLHQKRRQLSLESEASARRSIEKFCKDDASKAEAEELIPDMIDAAKKFRISGDEYFLYRFSGKSDEERLQFISDAEHFELCRKLNKTKNQVIFDKKAKTAEVFRNFYHRDVCTVYGKNELDEFKAFISKHERFIVKPLANGCGVGIKIVGANEEGLIESLLRSYCHKGLSSGFVAEELIKEVEELKRFHPSSVNTVRVPTIRLDDEVVFLHPFFRTGNGGSIIDNAAAGGVFGVIDPETGIITHVGDEKGNFYNAHPYSGVQMLGYQIPRWEEAKEFVRKLTQVVPSNRYTGWDIALTEEGWLMVEGNAAGQFVWQIPMQEGSRNELRSICEKVGVKV